jgi:pyruvate,water dikinase
MKIFTLDGLPEAEYDHAGGKARGLAALIRAGLPVAAGFVITGLETEADYEEAAAYYLKSGLQNVAVRSSAAAEDGADFSNAGQYRTCLNISGKDAFIGALRECIASLHNTEAESYSAFFAQAESASMSIVVQAMVDAAVAGVCFTVDPVTGSRDLLIEAVSGLGESLVSGQRAAERHIVPLNRGSGESADSGAAGKAAVSGHGTGPGPFGPILDEQTITRISADVRRAMDYFHYELDLEWAIGKDGNLIWLQARPITTLDEAAIDELDPREVDETAVITTCNIGEMLPGAVTHLSLSTSVRGIDHGMRAMLAKAGAYRSVKDIHDGDCILTFSNHLFINLTTLYKLAAAVVGAQKESVEASICGKSLENTPPLPWKDKPLPIKLVNGIRYFSFLFSNKRAMKRIDTLLRAMEIPRTGDLKTFYKNLDRLLRQFIDVTYCHYATSAHSGAMSSTLLIIIKTEYEVDEQARAVLSGLLEDIDNIESVDILRTMRRLAAEVLKQNPEAVQYSPDQLAVYIKNETGAIREAYDYFISRHGHRAIREAELRMKSWKQDETGLMENILMVMRSGAVEEPKNESRYQENREAFLAGKKGIARKGLEFLINQARTGAYNRELTKSKFVKGVDILKTAYAELADKLVEAGALPEQDLIYFLSHEEIGELIFERKAKLIKKAVRRRRLLDEQMEVRFNEVSIGRPKPIRFEGAGAENGMILSGAPISRGEVTGTARVVKTIADAKKLREGEIMVAAFTDIGWSPYYCVIKGLITEVGSALSHGAVVAREYALPVVANISNVTSIIKTGDYITMNGSTGTVTVLEIADDLEETAG